LNNSIYAQTRKASGLRLGREPPGHHLARSVHKTGVTYTGTSQKYFDNAGKEKSGEITGAISIPVIFSVSF
jgi:hypothetical protein